MGDCNKMENGNEQKNIFPEFGKRNYNQEKMENGNEQKSIFGSGFGRTYYDQVVVKMGSDTIMWREGMYERKGPVIDTELIIDIYENGAKAKESKIRKMRKVIWILVIALFIMVNILLSLLI